MFLVKYKHNAKCHYVFSQIQTYNLVYLGLYPIIVFILYYHVINI